MGKYTIPRGTGGIRKSHRSHICPIIILRLQRKQTNKQTKKPPKLNPPKRFFSRIFFWHQIIWERLEIIASPDKNELSWEITKRRNTLQWAEALVCQPDDLSLLLSSQGRTNATKLFFVLYTHDLGCIPPCPRSYTHRQSPHHTDTYLDTDTDTHTTHIHTHIPHTHTSHTQAHTHT